MGAEWGGELVLMPFESLSILPAIKAAHNMESLCYALTTKKNTGK